MKIGEITAKVNNTLYAKMPKINANLKQKNIMTHGNNT